MESQENGAADLVAKQADFGESFLVAWALVAPLLKLSNYTEAELKWAKTEGAIE